MVEFLVPKEKMSTFATPVITPLSRFCEYWVWGFTRSNSEILVRNQSDTSLISGIVVWRLASGVTLAVNNVTAEFLWEVLEVSGILAYDLTRKEIEDATMFDDMMEFREVEKNITFRIRFLVAADMLREECWWLHESVWPPRLILEVSTFSYLNSITILLCQTPVKYLLVIPLSAQKNDLINRILKKKLPDACSKSKESKTNQEQKRRWTHWGLNSGPSRILEFKPMQTRRATTAP